jgi:hypothetical protein
MANAKPDTPESIYHVEHPARYPAAPSSAFVSQSHDCNFRSKGIGGNS